MSILNEENFGPIVNVMHRGQFSKLRWLISELNQFELYQ